MSRKEGRVFYIYSEIDQVCEYCGQVRETRPYGAGGKEICIDCAEKPENKQTVEKNFNDILNGKKHIPLRNDIARAE